jgi:biotin transport system substrate-specific component
MSTLTTHATLADALVPPRAHRWTRDLALALLFSGFMALTARIAVPLPWTPVPITAQTLGVLLVGALLGPRLGALTMLLYLGEGLIGLPVFSLGRNAWTPAGTAGLPLIVGPTAGYLLSYPLAAALVGALATRGWDRRIGSAVAAMALGNAVILLLGFLWLLASTALLTGTVNVGALLLASVVPFLPGDALKIAIAALALPGGWALVRR